MFSEITPLGVILFPPRARDYLTKTLVTGMRNLLLSYWSRNSEALKTIIGYCFVWVFFCLPEVKGKSLLLEIQHVLNIGLNRVSLDLPWGLVFHSIGRCYGNYQGDKVINESTQF